MDQLCCFCLVFVCFRRRLIIDALWSSSSISSIAAFFANLSATSLNCTSLCPGVHTVSKLHQFGSSDDVFVDF